MRLAYAAVATAGARAAFMGFQPMAPVTVGHGSMVITGTPSR